MVIRETILGRRDKLSKVATLPLGVSVEQLELSNQVLLEDFLIALDGGEDNFGGIEDGVNDTKFVVEFGVKVRDDISYFGL